MSSLKREKAGVYVTHDGRYEVSRGVAYTDCYEPHPVRLSRGTREVARYGSDEDRRRIQFHLLPWEGQAAAKSNEPGYQCPGQQEHAYTSWGVWDRKKDDYVSDESRHFDTKKAAVAWLHKHQEEEAACRRANAIQNTCRRCGGRGEFFATDGSRDAGMSRCGTCKGTGKVPPL